MNRRRRELFAGLFLVTISTLICLIGAELLVRHLDGYRLFSLPLTPSKEDILASALVDRDNSELLTQAKADASSLSTAPGIERAFYDIDPAPLPADERNQELVLRSKEGGGNIGCAFIWNRDYLQHLACAKTTMNLERCPSLYTFDAPGEDSIYPTFHYFPDTVTPMGLHTNQYGWRGRAITLNRPNERIVRIAFVGASTTVSPHYYPFSYPEYIEAWLNLWAESRYPQVRFEVINAGRTGIGSPSIREIVRREIAPLRPDLVIYFEGANQFWPADFLSWDDPNAAVSRPKETFARMTEAERYFALVARAVRLIRRQQAEGAEPEKPGFTIDWPKELDEFDPDPSSPLLPLALNTILADIESARKATEEQGGRFAIASFLWFVKEGMTLDPRRDIGIYRSLNETYWPFSYAHMRRMADFQNRTLKAFATQQGIAYFPFAERYPDDQRYFADPIHMRQEGVKMKGWVMLQPLVELLDPLLAEGALPRAKEPPLDRHPFYDDAVKGETTIATLAQECV